MKNYLEQKVYYSDTDAYGVVWHGSYLKWLEMGRVELCEMLGPDLVSLENQNIVMPVVNLNIKFKSSAKLNDKIIIETSIKSFSGLKVVFKQKITEKNTSKVFIEAEIDVVAIDNEGKLYRKMPTVLIEMFEKASNEDRILESIK